MNLVLSGIAWISCLVVLLTSWAKLQDTRASPIDRSRRGWLRHIAHLVLLDLMTGFAGVVFVVPSLWPATVWSVGPLAVLAAHMAINSPCPWWRYVFQNRGRTQSLGTRMRPF